MALEFASEELKSNYRVVEVAVQNCGLALQHAGEDCVCTSSAIQLASAIVNESHPNLPLCPTPRKIASMTW